MWIRYNPNPTGRTVGDCAVRAIAKALKIDWETAYELIATNGYRMGDMPSSDSVWGSVLRENGFYRRAIPNRCPDCYTAADFARDNPVGTFVLAFGGLEIVDKLAHTVKNLDKIIEKYEESEMGGASHREGSSYAGDERRQSRMGGSYRYGGSSYEDGGSSYARGRGRNARRDSMGRYSRADATEDIIEELHTLMQEAPNQQIKQEIQNTIKKMEQM